MSDVVICCENLSKQYRIGARQEPYPTLRDSLADMAKAPLRALLRVGRDRSCSGVETIWALKDVSFEVKRGEVVGIIGRNGAGKSTLLSILSRITEPTEGVARLKGRVVSLLEVGTGFHPELTGRENIYLNAAILGMRKAEVNRKFDEIVAFAEVEKFINTPVKHYSSGMYMRLAFAVAAHLDPEILIVDEVLAVGDIEFQKKCLGKMGDVAKAGRTVLLVSHDMAAIRRLCSRVLLLDNGHVRYLGTTDEAVAVYIEQGAQHSGEYRWEANQILPSGDAVRLLTFRIRNQNGETASSLDRMHPFFVEITYEMLRPISNMQIGFWLLANDGTLLFVAGDREDVRWQGQYRPPGIYTSTAKIPGGLLNGGRYLLRLGMDIPVGHTVFLSEPTLNFVLEQTEAPAHSAHGGSKPPGHLCLSLEWNIHRQ